MRGMSDGRRSGDIRGGGVVHLFVGGREEKRHAVNRGTWEFLRRGINSAGRRDREGLERERPIGCL